MILLRLSTYASTAAILTACWFDGTSPVQERFSGVYVASSIMGSGLPATIRHGTDKDILLADTLKFSNDGMVYISLAFRRVSTTSSPADTVYRVQMRRPYVIDGTRVTIGMERCPINALCMGPEIGEIDSSGAQLRSAFWPEGAKIHFRRVSSE